MLALYSAPGLDGVYWKGPGVTYYMTELEPKVIQHVVSMLLCAHPVKPVVCLSTRTSEAKSAAALCPLCLSQDEVSLEVFFVDKTLRVLTLSCLGSPTGNNEWAHNKVFLLKEAVKGYPAAHFHQKKHSFRLWGLSHLWTILVESSHCTQNIMATKALLSGEDGLKMICGSTQVHKHLYSGWQLNCVSHVSWCLKASYCFNRLFYMQPCFRKGTGISTMLNSLTDPLHGERVRLRSLYECHRSSQAWASLWLGEWVVALPVDLLPQEDAVGLWDKRLMTWRNSETQGQTGGPQYPGQRHKALPLFSYQTLFWTVFLTEGYFACMRVYGASNWSCTLGHRAQVPGVPESGEARAHAHCLGTYASMWLLANVKLDLPASWIRGWKARQRPEGLPALHQWPKGTAGPGNPRVRVSTAGEIGDPGPLLGQAECLEPASRGIHMGCMCFPLTGCHPDPLERGTGWGHGTVCVCKCCVFCLCWSILLAIGMYKYGMCVSLLGIRAQPHCWLVRGLRSCSSLPSVGLLGTTSPNRWALLCQKGKPVS